MGEKPLMGFHHRQDRVGRLSTELGPSFTDCCLAPTRAKLHRFSSASTATTREVALPTLDSSGPRAEAVIQDGTRHVLWVQHGRNMVVIVKGFFPLAC